MDQVFAEQRGFAVQHVFMPAVIYYYTQNIYKFFTIIFLFESFEYLIAQIDHTWQEDPGDSLVGDILMATLGMLAIRQIDYENRPWWYIAIHITVLAVANVVTVQLLWNEITWSYVFYGIVVSIMGMLISTRWAIFTVVNVIIISAIATRGFMHPFSHTPVAVLISLPITTLILIIAKPPSYISA